MWITIVDKIFSVPLFFRYILFFIALPALQVIHNTVNMIIWFYSQPEVNQRGKRSEPAVGRHSRRSVSFASVRDLTCG